METCKPWPVWADDREKGLSWLGERMPAGAYEAALAQAHGQGLEVQLGEDGGRWHRGSISFEERGWLVQVNSQSRLDRLREVLEQLGHPADVVSKETRAMEPESADEWKTAFIGLLPSPGGVRADEIWLRNLPDMALPGLDELSPRQAAERPEYRGRLEHVLRHLEYESEARDADLDFATLRRDLGLAAGPDRLAESLMP